MLILAFETKSAEQQKLQLLFKFLPTMSDLLFLYLIGRSWGPKLSSNSCSRFCATSNALEYRNFPLYPVWEHDTRHCWAFENWYSCDIMNITSITPNLVKPCLAISSFDSRLKSQSFIHLKAQRFRQMKDRQVYR